MCMLGCMDMDTPIWIARLHAEMDATWHNTNKKGQCSAQGSHIIWPREALIYVALHLLLQFEGSKPQVTVEHPYRCSKSPFMVPHQCSMSKFEKIHIKLKRHNKMCPIRVLCLLMCIKSLKSNWSSPLS